jgi:hypothetical protein
MRLARFPILLLIAVALAPLAAQAQPILDIVVGDSPQRVTDLPAGLSTYSAPVIFKDLPALVSPLRAFVSGFVILFLAAALVGGFNRQADEIPQMLATIALIAAFAASTGKLLNLGLVAVDEIVDKSGVGSNLEMAQVLWPLFMTLTDADADDLTEEGPSEEARWYTRWWGYLKEGAEMTLNAVLGGWRIVVGFCVWASMVLVSFATALVAVLADTLRYFIVYLSSVLLPLAVGALALPSLRNVGFNYIMSVIGVLAWPLGWMMVNMGTMAIYNAFLKVLTGQLLTESEAAQVHLQNAQQVPEIFRGVNILGQMTALSMGSLMIMFALLIGMFCWALLGAVGAPILISRTITQGANFAAPMAGATLQGMAKAVGSALKLGAMSGMASTVAGGGSPTAGQSASYAAGQTLVNMSRASGDAASFVGVPDSARDERLRTASQMAEKATNRAIQAGGGKLGGTGKP